MAVSEAEIEALALGAMRAWVAGDVKAMKKLTGKDFLMLVGSTPPQLLDRQASLQRWSAVSPAIASPFAR